MLLRRRLSSVSASNGNGSTPKFLRVLGVDPAAAGPTGYGIIESDGRRLKTLHYGALRVPAKRQKESSGAALHYVHELLCSLIKDFAPEVLAVESIFSPLNVCPPFCRAKSRGG